MSSGIDGLTALFSSELGASKQTSKQANERVNALTMAKACAISLPS